MFASIVLVQRRASYSAEATYLHRDPAKLCRHFVCSETLSGMRMMSAVGSCSPPEPSMALKCGRSVPFAAMRPGRYNQPL